MGKIFLQTRDGITISAYENHPQNAKSGVVILQEIFGVNDYISSVCDIFAKQGYHVIAPALFDRIEKNVTLNYDQKGIEKGLYLRSKLQPNWVMADIIAAANHISHPKAIIGYCWGGTLAWYSACQTDMFSAAISWYGGEISAAAEKKPNCPVQLHFGAEDPSIPLSDIEIIHKAHPQIPVYIYEKAGHGFGCTARPSFNKPAYELALQRTLDFLKKNLDLSYKCPSP